MAEKRSEVDVAIRDGSDHGYWGRSTDPTPREAYTVAGQTGGTTGNVADEPKSVTKARAAKTTPAKPSVRTSE